MSKHDKFGFAPDTAAPSDIYRTGSARSLVPVRPARRNFMAAGTDRLVSDWSTTDLSLNDIFSHQTAKIRARARELERNSPLTQQFLRTVTANVVGPDGIRLRARPMNAPDEVDELAKMRLEAGWKGWGKIRNCTLQRRQSWVEVQEMVLRRTMIDGEMFIRLYDGARNDYAFAVDLLPAELCDETLNRARGHGKNQIKFGVEVDLNNVPVAYHFFSDVEAAAPDRQHVRVPAENIIHVYRMERPWQVRGISWCVQPMWRQKMLDKYEEAIVVGARVAACKMGVYTGSKPTFDGTFTDGAQVEDVEPGVTRWIGEDSTFSMFDPDYPPASYVEFMKQGIHMLAAGYGVSYESLSRDLSGVNYSSIREGKLADQDNWRCLQRFLRERVHEEIYPRWLMMALAGDTLNLPLAKFEKFNAATWQGRGWAWVDPAKEIQAAKQAHDMGIKPLELIASEQGLELEELFQMYARERNLADKYNLNFETETPGVPAAAPEDEDDAADDQDE